MEEKQMAQVMSHDSCASRRETLEGVHGPSIIPSQTVTKVNRQDFPDILPILSWDLVHPYSNLLQAN